MSFLDRLRELAGAFEHAGSHEFVTGLKKDAPVWLRGEAGAKVMSTIAGSVSSVVGVERAPDDWIYQATAEVAGRLLERAPADVKEARLVARKIKGLDDVLYSRLTAWLADNSLHNLTLCDEAVKKLRVPEGAPIIRRIQAGQHLAYTRIVKAVIAVCDSADEGMVS